MNSGITPALGTAPLRSVGAHNRALAATKQRLAAAIGIGSGQPIIPVAGVILQPPGTYSSVLTSSAYDAGTAFLSIARASNTSYQFMSFGYGSVGGLHLTSDAMVGWVNSASSSVGSPDTMLFRGTAAGVIEQRNSTNPQQFLISGTWTSTTNYERFFIKSVAASNFCIGTEKGSGGGTARGLEIQTDGTTRITIGSAGQLGFYGVAAVARQVLATGAGATVDNVITALQNLGLVSQT